MMQQRGMRPKNVAAARSPLESWVKSKKSGKPARQEVEASRKEGVKAMKKRGLQREVCGYEIIWTSSPWAFLPYVCCETRPMKRAVHKKRGSK